MSNVNISNSIEISEVILTFSVSLEFRHNDSLLYLNFELKVRLTIMIMLIIINLSKMYRYYFFSVNVSKINF